MSLTDSSRHPQVPALLTLGEAVIAAGFPSIRFLHREVSGGRLRTVHIGRRSFVARVELDRYLHDLLIAHGLKDVAGGVMVNSPPPPDREVDRCALAVPLASRTPLGDER